MQFSVWGYWEDRELSSALREDTYIDPARRGQARGSQAPDCTKHYQSEGQKDSTVVRALAYHMASPGSIPGTLVTEQYPCISVSGAPHLGAPELYGVMNCPYFPLKRLFLFCGNKQNLQVPPTGVIPEDDWLRP